MGRGQRWNPVNLRNLRQAFGLSPEGFAERVGWVSASTVRRWESGRHVPMIHHLEAIADAFDIDLAVFFEPANPGPRAPQEGSRATVRCPARSNCCPTRGRATCPDRRRVLAVRAAHRL